MAVYSKAWQETLAHVGRVPETTKAGFTVNLVQCKFAESKVRYMGQVVRPGVHSPNLKMVEAILQLKLIVTKEDLRHVLGLFNSYHEYILLLLAKAASIGEVD